MTTALKFCAAVCALALCLFVKLSPYKQCPGDWGLDLLYLSLNPLRAKQNYTILNMFHQAIKSLLLGMECVIDINICLCVVPN